MRSLEEGGSRVALPGEAGAECCVVATHVGRRVVGAQGVVHEVVREVVYLVAAGVLVDEAVARLGEPCGLDVVAFDSIGEFLEYRRMDECSCLVLELGFQEEEGFALQCRLAAEASPPVIFLCGHRDVPSVVRALKSGAVELLTPPLDSAELAEAMRAAFVQDRRQRRQRAEREELRGRYALLTPREREVLPLIVRGLLNKQAASVLGISEVTLQIHRSQVMRKMRAESVADLVRMAARLRIPLWGKGDARREALPSREHGLRRAGWRG